MSKLAEILARYARAETRARARADFYFGTTVTFQDVEGPIEGVVAFVEDDTVCWADDKKRIHMTPKKFLEIVR